MSLSLPCLVPGSLPKSVMTLTVLPLLLVQMGDLRTSVVTCCSCGFLPLTTECRLGVAVLFGARGMDNFGAAACITGCVGCDGSGGNSLVVALAWHGSVLLFRRVPVLVPIRVHRWPSPLSTAWHWALARRCIRWSTVLLDMCTR